MDHAAAIEYILTRLDNELPHRLTYHNPRHTRDVLDRCRQIARAEGIATDSETFHLLETAAAFHDCGFLLNNREHEKLGCRVAREQLPRFGYTTPQIDLVRGMIMATRIPQQPRSPAECIICDADLDYLGRDDFYTIGQTLFAELKAYGVLNTELEWNRLQVGFIGKHRYWTATNRDIRGPVKRAYLDDLIVWVANAEQRLVD